MADSKEVKPSKGKGKFISDTSDTMKENPEVFIPKPDMTPEQINALFSIIIETLSDSDIDVDPKAKQTVDLVKEISELYEKVTEQKAWALQKVAESDMRLKEHDSELQELRTAKAKWGDTENKRDDSETSRAIKMKEEYIQHKCFQLNAINDTVRRLELENAQIRADTLAYKMSASESEKKLIEILKKGKESVKKLADMENQSSALKTQYEKELLRAEQMEQELIQTKKEAKEVEIQWKQEIKEKDRLLALLAEETRLSKLRQQVDTECQVAEDDEAGLSLKPKSHLLCMVCIENVVSVYFLPCAHQVLCFPCYENLQISLAHCPYCGIGIEQSMKVNGPSS